MRELMAGLVALMLMNSGVGATVAEHVFGARSVWAVSTSSASGKGGERFVGLVLASVAERLGLR